MHIIRSIAPLAAILVTAIGLTACSSESSGPDGDSDAPAGFLTLVETQTEYDETIADFPYALPEGRTFPEEVQQPTQDTIFQEGSGLVQAYQFWECAWMNAALTAQGSDQSAFEAAIVQLEDTTSSVYRTQYMDDPDDAWAGIALARAKLGDSSVLSDFYTSDCSWYRVETGQ